MLPRRMVADLIQVPNEKQLEFPLKEVADGCQHPDPIQMIFVTASIGTARIAPGTPHIQYQK